MRMPALRAGLYRRHAEESQATLIDGRFSTIRSDDPDPMILTECLCDVAHAPPERGYPIVNWTQKV
jgi:hypothetical protein